MTDRQFVIAWENAPKIENDNPNQFIICYICEDEMNHGTKWNSESQPAGGWTIDHIDGNNKNNNDNNLAATHYECNNAKGNKNYLNKYNNVVKKNFTR